jgi:hypothetical protein
MKIEGPPSIAEAMLDAHKLADTKLLTNDQIMYRLLNAALEEMQRIGMAKEAQVFGSSRWQAETCDKWEGGFPGIIIRFTGELT